MGLRLSKGVAAYVGLLLGAFAVGILASHHFAGELDNYAYDYFLLHARPKAFAPESVILAIDEPTLRAGGIQGIRQKLAEALPVVEAAQPKVVAIDMALTDPSQDPKVDARLARVFQATPNLILGTEWLPSGWDDPLPEFKPAASEGDDWLGEVHAHPDTKDEITRSVHLEISGDRKKRWALSLQAFRLYCGESYILESPQALKLGNRSIPIASDEGRRMRILFAPPGAIPKISLNDLLRDHKLANKLMRKAVFVGVTAITELQDRLMTPGGRQMAGVEIHANAFETLVHGGFITDIPDAMAWIVLFSFSLTVASGLCFRYLPGWTAYAGGVVIVAIALLAPYVAFRYNRVFSFKIPVTVAVLSVGAAAGYYHLVTRRNWRIEQAARTRYQQAMQFVTHEMRTPLSAIQGSSELISRFPLTEEKRQQVALLINSESKRLARMVEIFLSVERLSAGQVELKRERIPVSQMVAVCADRVKPLADRKHISIHLEPVPEEIQLMGDRELMEYACYNLLTNAVKYSPQKTDVMVSARKFENYIRIAVKDQGIGLDEKEVTQIFQKFYRTKKAEESGEAGTGIGLSIVQQIVERHGGKIDVVSYPGKGSCFTLAIPVGAAVAGAELSS